tara:strand:- start:247 stop:453 length:207 start_codon:yes stop_codon:yes gene_type:complete
MIKQGNIVLEKCVSFSLNIIDFCEILEKERKYVISNQLLKSATSIGANVHEAQNAESKLELYIKLRLH